MTDEEHLPGRVGLLGAGVIGGGWAARFLLAGVDVCLYDPAPGAGDGALAALERARRAWDRLALTPRPSEGRLTLATSVADAVAGAELVQESALSDKSLVGAAGTGRGRCAARRDHRQLHLGAASLPAGASMAGPERFVVGHPFNPVYLLPLVEVCGAAPQSSRRP